MSSSVAICPTVTAYNEHDSQEQMKCASTLSHRIHLDLMDGVFAPTVSPALNKLWLPHGCDIDIHLMFQRPMEQLEWLQTIKPHMVIIHAEADVHHALFAAEMHRAGIKAGLALLADTTVSSCEEKIEGFDHALIFSGHLGYHGGKADLSLLHKVPELLAHHPELEIGWDGGIHADNAAKLVEAGIDILNVGGYIQKSDNPKAAYATLKEVIKS